MVDCWIGDKLFLTLANQYLDSALDRKPDAIKHLGIEF